MNETPDAPDGQLDPRLPPAVAGRLQALLDRQDAGIALTTAEKDEADALVRYVELASLLRLHRERGDE